MRVLLLLIVLAFVSGCVTDERVMTHDRNDKHDPVPGEATPAPESGPHGGWAW